MRKLNRNYLKFQTSKHGRRQFHRLYPYTGLNGIDKKLLSYLPESPAVFLEAGANDGIRQSNTYFLEKRRGWKGILIEPVPHLARSCRKARKSSQVFQYALGAPEQTGETVQFTDLDLMGRIVSHQEDREHILAAEKHHGMQARVVDVSVRTMSEIIDQSNFQDITFMSLDVEGYEQTVLAGLDLSRHCPEWLLIETAHIGAIRQILKSVMSEVTQLSHHDYLFRRDESGSISVR